MNTPHVCLYQTLEPKIKIFEIEPFGNVETGNLPEPHFRFS